MTEYVSFLDLVAPYRELRQELDQAVNRVVERGWFILGDELEKFEREYAEYLGVRNCIGVANGLDALHLGLRALGIGPGDEVIVPTHTFIATWLAVTHVGAIPVGVEPDERTYNIDVERIEGAITDRTRAIIPVHLYGQPVAMDKVMEIARARGLRVVEDAAQAHGSQFRDRYVGGHGDLCAWSFYPGKNLGAFGDGGAITTNDDGLAVAVRKWRNYGSTTKYLHELPGYNSRLDEIQAAILRVKLPHLDEWNSRRARIASRYSSELVGLGLILPFVPEWAAPVWHLYVVRHARRDALATALSALGVQTIIHYPIAPPAQPTYRGVEIDPSSYHIATRLSDDVLSLPIGPHMSDDDVSRVIVAVRTALSDL